MVGSFGGMFVDPERKWLLDGIGSGRVKLPSTLYKAQSTSPHCTSTGGGEAASSGPLGGHQCIYLEQSAVGACQVGKAGVP